MMNLLQETVEVLAKNQKTPADVLSVGTVSHTLWELLPEKYHEKVATYGTLTWSEFASIADVEYNDCFGLQRVNEDLMIVGADWWLERHEYDGSEWWEYKTLPVLPRV